MALGTMGKIICRGAGIAGMSAVLYDAYLLGRNNSQRTALKMEADKYERIHADTRTLSTESHVKNAIQKKTANLRMNNPLVSIWGKIKGFTSGLFTSLGENLVPTVLASFALLSKGVGAKIGAWGLAGCALFTVAKEGFGLAKHSPVD